MSQPIVSIILVAWNSAIYMPRCLSGLVAQTYSDFEVIIIDNGSSDEALSGLEEKYPILNLRVERLQKNLGFAVANNIGARLANGKWLALLNADAFPAPDWLEQLVQAADDNPGFTFFTSRQIQANTPELLDGTGDAYHVSGFAWRQHYNHPASKYGFQSAEVFSACAAAALYSRDDFIKIGGFDEDYFSYFEDVDLGFRLRLTGGRCLYVPEAVVHHIGSASTGKASDFTYYHGHRNLVWTFFKDMPDTLFLVYLPLHMLMNIYFSVSLLLRENRNILLKSQVDAYRFLPATLRKRRRIQQSRTVSTGEIYRVMIKELFVPFWASRERSKRKST
jgi:GT2 family glycosyltransferase